MPKYVVETITVFKHVYVVEADQASFALDLVTLEEAEEIDQTYLGETITSVLLADEDNVVCDPVDMAKKLDT